MFFTTFDLVSYSQFSLRVVGKLLQFMVNADIITSSIGIASSHEFIFKDKDVFPRVPQQTSLHVSFARIKTNARA